MVSHCVFTFFSSRRDPRLSRHDGLKLNVDCNLFQVRNHQRPSRPLIDCLSVAVHYYVKEKDLALGLHTCYPPLW